MTIGEKIKNARVEKKMTQADLAGDKITRNMLSLIESGKCSASLDTLEYLSERLQLPISFLVSGENDIFYYRKKEKMYAINSALEAKNYNVVISLVHSIDGLDDELAYILAFSYFELGMTSVMGGSFVSSKKYFDRCIEFSKKTKYDTKRFEAIIPLYYSVIGNVNSPLLEFEENSFILKMQDAFDYEFYKYLTLDLSYPFTSFYYKEHTNAKILIKERKYQDAIRVLSDIEQARGNHGRNAYVMFGVYTDLEYCYKQIADFENAYRYASKRISLLEGFQS